MTSALERLEDLAAEPADAKEFAGLKRAGLVRLVFQVLPHTLGLGAEVWRVLAKGHDIRNRGEYEGELDVDERIVSDLITACKVVAAKIEHLEPLR